MAACQVLLGVLLGTLTFLAWHFTSIFERQDVDSLAEDLRKSILQRTRDKMSSLLDARALDTESYSRLMGSSLVGVRLEEEHFYDWSPRAFTVNAAFFIPDPSRSTVIFTTTTGLWTALLRAGGTAWLLFSNTTGFESTANGTSWAYYAAANVSTGAQLNASTPLSMKASATAFDWYRSAIASKQSQKVHCAMVNAGYSIVVASLTCSTAVFDSAGDLRGAVAITSTIGAVSQLVESLDLLGGVLWFTTVPDGILVAAAGHGSSNSSSFYSRNATIQTKATESSDPVIKAGAEYLDVRYGLEALAAKEYDLGLVRVGGVRYFINTVPINDYNISLVAIIMIPRYNIFHEIDRRGHWELGILVGCAFGIFMVGIILLFLFTGRVSSEIRLKAEVIEHLEAKRRAEASSNYKTAFLCNMSHELRTPMAGIMGLLDVLMADNLTDEQATNVDQIHRCATGLLGLLNDILDLSKIEAGKLHLEKSAFYPCKELENLINVFFSPCQKKNVDLALDVDESMPHVALGDPIRFRQIFSNLLSNATKFTREGYVVLRASATRDCRITLIGNPALAAIHDRDDFEDLILLTMEIDDTGCGIPPEKRELVFEDFMQADTSTTRIHGGTGLGLGIVKKLVTLMDGSVEIVDKPGPGTLFRVNIYLSLPPKSTVLNLGADVTATPMSLPKRLSGCPVLLAMPTAPSRDILTRSLERQGLQLVQVGAWSDIDAAWVKLLDRVRPAVADATVMKQALPLLAGLVRTVSLGKEPKARRASPLASPGMATSPVQEVGTREQGVGRPFIIAVMDVLLLPGYPQVALEEVWALVSRMKLLATGCTFELAWLTAADMPAGLRRILAYDTGTPARLLSKPVYPSRAIHFLGQLTVKEKATLVEGEGGEDPKDDMSKAALIQTDADCDSGQGVQAETGLLRAGDKDTQVQSMEQAADGGVGDLDDNLQVVGGPKARQPLRQGSLPVAVASTMPKQPILSSSSYPPSAAKTGESPRALAGFRILVAEDTPVLQRLATMMLKKLGAHVVAVNDGREAVLAVTEAVARHQKLGYPKDPLYSSSLPALTSDNFENYPFHAILMDCQMPVMDGYSAAMEIRNMERGTGRHIAIVACTAHAMASDKEKCLQAGMDAYLAKPVNSKLLVSTFQDLVLKEQDSLQCITELAQDIAS
eukprot:SM000025S08356  [mRNA]  locus=s25:281624:287890:- [translate_table: standard]